MKIVRDTFRGGHRYWFYCPGCKCAHAFTVGCEGLPNQNWSWKPIVTSFHPSLKMFYTHPETEQPITTCHLFVKNGKIEYCGDCPHELKGQTIDLPDFPEGYILPVAYETVL